jgi:hypothetical protein
MFILMVDFLETSPRRFESVHSLLPQSSRLCSSHSRLTLRMVLFNEARENAVLNAIVQ